MRRAIIFAWVSVLVTIVPSLATIINVPDDYPTIQQGIDASSDGDTVLVQPGTYYENINFNGHNIVLGSLFLMTGDTAYISATIIDGSFSGSVVTFESGEDSAAVITGFTLEHGIAERGGGVYCVQSGPAVSNNIIRRNDVYGFYAEGGGIYLGASNARIASNTIINNSAENIGGAIYCEDSDVNIEHNTVAGNTAHGGFWLFGGGIACVNSDATIRDNIIRGNTALSSLGGQGGGILVVESRTVICRNKFIGNQAIEGGAIWCGGQGARITGNTFIGNYADWGAGIFCSHSTPFILNNTFSANTARFEGCVFIDNSDASIANSIFWGNGPSEIHIESGTALIYYCGIQGGWEGEGNIDVDPLFRDPDNGDLHLMAVQCGDSADSPCIDAGHPDILDSLLDCAWGLGDLRSDMGAYGGGDSVTVGIGDEFSGLPGRFSLLQNYPNPFNARTTIRYALDKASFVTIEIYDILGRKVETLVSAEQQAGYHQIIWDAGEQPSGVYFCRIQAGGYQHARKMVILK